LLRQGDGFQHGRINADLRRTGCDVAGHLTIDATRY
jgi:hypothetical protein